MHAMASDNVLGTSHRHQSPFESPTMRMTEGSERLSDLVKYIHSPCPGIAFQYRHAYKHTVNPNPREI